MTFKAGEQVQWCDLDIWSGKMSPELSAATEEKTSQPSLKKRSKSLNRKPPLFLCLKRDGLQQDACLTWTEDGALLGEYTMHSFGECPREENVSRLSAILEEKPTPEVLFERKGLSRDSEQSGAQREETARTTGNGLEGAISFQERAGCPGGGKGILIQNERTGALSTLNKLDTSVPDPSKNQGGVCILDMVHPCDIIRDCGGTSPSLQARMGTGGNQVPLVTYGIGNGQVHEAMTMAQEVSQTLNTMHDKQAILYQPKSAMEENWAESKIKNAIRAGESKVSHAVMCEDVSHTLRAKANCAYREDTETYPVQNMMVRRLTPLECERLQGYPDGWTDIGDWTDSKGKKHKEADSPRYKALGNSIALPFWFWLLRRISAQYERPATLGSLFDGIGGFPLCWTRCNGKGTALWASEVEPFCIAVTEMRFGRKVEQ